MIKSNPGVRKKNDNFSARKPSPFPGDHRSDLSAGGHTGRHARLAAEPIKVAGIYTVPVEQQWVSRIHKAAQAAQARGEIDYAFSENVTNTDYPRVMREYAESGVKLIVGEIFGVEQEAREVVLDYPDTAFLLGSSFLRRPGLSEPRGVRQLHPGRLVPVRHHRRCDDRDGQYRHGRWLSDPRGQPADARLHGGRARDQARRHFPGQLHRLLVRSAQGQGNRLRDDRERRRPALRRTLRRVGRGTRKRAFSPSAT